MFNWYRCDSSCNNGCASFFNSATIFANFFHLYFIGSTEFGKCVVTPIFVSSSAAGVGAAARATMVSAGGYFREGLLPVPEKLVKKILKFEFIEMYELLPETWLRDQDESRKGLVGLPRRKSAPVTIPSVGF